MRGARRQEELAVEPLGGTGFEGDVESVGDGQNTSPTHQCGSRGAAGRVFFPPPPQMRQEQYMSEMKETPPNNLRPMPLNQWMQEGKTPDSDFVRPSTGASCSFMARW